MAPTVGAWRTLVGLGLALVTLEFVGSCEESRGPVQSPLPSYSACMERAVFGDPAESPYVLPYPVGAAYEVFQGYCQGGHLLSNQLAYDFIIPTGADIVAARAGVVGHVEDRYEDTDSVVGHFN